MVLNFKLNCSMIIIKIKIIKKCWIKSQKFYKSSITNQEFS